MSLEKIANRVTTAMLEAWRQTIDTSLLTKLTSILAPVNPGTVAEACEFRLEQRRSLEPCEVVPCDIHAFGIGEPERRHTSKVGGLPYLPTTDGWPHAADGTAYAFICQFDLRGSQDILPELPGDVLLVFSRQDIIAYGLADELYFRWINYNDLPLIAAEDCRGDKMEFIGFGLPCRTFDFVDQRTCASLWSKWYSECPENKKLGLPVDRVSYGSARFEGFKIGGLAPWVLHSQNEAETEWGNHYYPSASEISELRYICGIGCIIPAWNIGCWPWVNQRDPIPDKWTNRDYLNWYDGFNVHFFISPEAEVKWAMDFT
jgi:hypothetical protein